MKKLISIFALSSVLVSSAFASTGLSCSDYNKMGPTLLGKVQDSRANFERELVRRIIEKVKRETRIKDFDIDRISYEADIEISDRSIEELEESRHCIDLDIQRLKSKL